MAERSIELDSIELAAAIFGNCDQNIHLLEKEFHVTAVCRGSVLRFTGAEADVDSAWGLRVPAKPTWRSPWR